jgi:hypothetical protein
LNEKLGPIVDYSNSRNIIISGRKSNFFRDMEDRYAHAIVGDKIYYLDKGEHFSTLFNDDSFPEVKHDGTLNSYGLGKINKKIKWQNYKNLKTF